MQRLKTNIFVQYTVSYFLILIIPLVIIAIISTNTLRDKQRDSMDTANRFLEQSMENLEVRFGELENIAMLLSSNADVGKILKPGRLNFFSYYSVYQTLSNFRLTNSFIQSAYILFYDEDMAVGSDGVITSSELYYRIRYDRTRAEYERWWSELWSRRYGGYIFRENTRINGQREDAVVYMQSIPMDSRTAGRACVVLFVRDQDLLPLISGYSEGAHSFTLVNSGGDEIFTASRGEEPQPSGTDGAFGTDGAVGADGGAGGIISVEGTAPSGRRYTYHFDERRLLSGWYDQLYLTLAFILAACLAGGLLSVFMARRSSTPIANILSLLHSPDAKGDREGQRNVLNYLQGTVSSLLYDNALMRKELSLRIPLLQVAFTERLLGGRLNDYTDIHEQLADIGINILGDSYSAAAFRIVDYGDVPAADVELKLSAARIIVEEVVWRFAVQNIWVYSIQESTVAVIFAVTDRRSPADIAALCAAAAEHLEATNRIRVRVGIGRAYEAIADVSISYLQAQRVLDGGTGGQKPDIALYDEYLDDRAYFNFPIELELKLIRTTLAGDTGTVEEIFDSLYAENIREGHLSSHMYRYFIGELNGTYLKVLSSLQDNRTISTEHLDELIGQTPYGEPFVDAFQMIRSLFMEVCAMVNRSRSQKAAEVGKDLEVYMQAHFTDPILNLARIAQDFGVSEVHMSRMFKDNMKYTFSQYLENLRLEQANRLLSTTALPIAGIAEACGYSSHHVFRRAYKRRYGILPSDGRVR